MHSSTMNWIFMNDVTETGCVISYNGAITKRATYPAVRSNFYIFIYFRVVKYS